MPQMFPCFWALLMLSLSAIFVFFMSSMSSNLIFFLVEKSDEMEMSSEGEKDWIYK